MQKCTKKLSSTAILNVKGVTTICKIYDFYEINECNGYLDNDDQRVQDEDGTNLMIAVVEEKEIEHRLDMFDFSQGKSLD